eukprot:scaffold5625_cov90-Skeletonema_dohrnii-CCMP3373.AAC.4
MPFPQGHFNIGLVFCFPLHYLVVDGLYRIRTPIVIVYDLAFAFEPLLLVFLPCRYNLLIQLFYCPCGIWNLRHLSVSSLLLTLHSLHYGHPSLSNPTPFYGLSLQHTVEKLFGTLFV